MTSNEIEEKITELTEIVCEELAKTTPTWAALESVALRLLDQYKTTNPEINLAVAEAAAVACRSILKASLKPELLREIESLPTRFEPGRFEAYSYDHAKNNREGIS